MKFAKTLAAGLMATSLIFAAEGEATENAAPAKKASNVGVGVRAAFNYNNMYGLADDWNVYADDNAEAPSGIGFEGGLGVKFQVLPFMQFTPEVLFNYAKLNQDDGDISRKFTQMGVEVPLLLRVNPILGAFLTIGPTLEFNVSDEEKVDYGVMKNGAGTFTHDWNEGFERNSFQFGLTLGAGYYFIDQLYADFRLNMGFTEVYKGKSQLVDLSGGKQMTFKFGLGYWFM